MILLFINRYNVNINKGEIFMSELHEQGRLTVNKEDLKGLKLPSQLDKLILPRPNDENPLFEENKYPDVKSMPTIEDLKNNHALRNRHLKRMYEDYLNGKFTIGMLWSYVKLCVIDINSEKSVYEDISKRLDEVLKIVFDTLEYYSSGRNEILDMIDYIFKNSSCSPTKAQEEFWDIMKIKYPYDTSKDEKSENNGEYYDYNYVNWLNNNDNSSIYKSVGLINNGAYNFLGSSSYTKYVRLRDDSRWRNDLINSYEFGRSFWALYSFSKSHVFASIEDLRDFVMASIVDINSDNTLCQPISKRIDKIVNVFKDFFEKKIFYNNEKKIIIDLIDHVILRCQNMLTRDQRKILIDIKLKYQRDINVFSSETEEKNIFPKIDKGLEIPNYIHPNIGINGFSANLKLSEDMLNDFRLRFLSTDTFVSSNIHGTNSMKELWDVVKDFIQMQKLQFNKEDKVDIMDSSLLRRLFSYIYVSSLSPHFDKSNDEEIKNMISYIYENSPYPKERIAEEDVAAKAKAEKHVFPTEDALGYSIQMEDIDNGDCKVASNDFEDDDLVGLWRYVFCEVNRCNSLGDNDENKKYEILLNLFRKIYHTISLTSFKEINLPLIKDIIDYIHTESTYSDTLAKEQAYKEVYGGTSRK